MDGHDERLTYFGGRRIKGIVTCTGFFGSFKSDFCFFQAILPISSDSRNKSAVKCTTKGESQEIRLMGRKTEPPFSNARRGNGFLCSSTSHCECRAVCICNMLLSSLSHAELLKSDWLEGWMPGFGQDGGQQFIISFLTPNQPGIKTCLIRVRH